MIDYYTTGNSPWKFVRTRVLGFEPGNPKGCPHNVFPDPPENTELVLETKTSVAFGEYGYYVCSNETRSVTEDGLKYKLKCLTNGRFQNRKWLKCRERGMCTKRPVIPSPSSNLNLSESRNVLEFDYANYTCKDPSQVLSPPTEDNIFRVLCKRKDKRNRNNFEQSVRVDWPTCIGKPISACDFGSLESLLKENSARYKLKEEKVSYILDGSNIEFVCKEEGFLAGYVPSISYRCDNTTFSPVGFTDVPTCRKPVECPMNFPEPPEESGLKSPQLLKPLKESETADYTCQKSGWSLFGDYQNAHDFVGMNSSSSPPSLSIVDGVLKLQCNLNEDKNTASIDTVSSWPKCRDEGIKQCLVSSIESQVGSMWPLTELTTTSNDSVNVGDYATIVCKNPLEVNEAFKEKKVKCKYDGTFDITEQFKACRLPDNCSSEIVSGDSKPWEANDNGLKITTEDMSSIQHFDIVEFGCSNNNKTMAGMQTTIDMSPGFIEQGMFKLPCKLDANGNWTLPNAWPSCTDKTDTCTVDSVVTNALEPTFVAPLTVSASVSNSISYQCKTSGHTTALGEHLDITCTESGKFDLPNPIPSCREPVLCENPPLPAEESRLLASTSTGVKEWENAIYNCRLGTNLTTDNFSLQCGSNGYYSKNPTFPVCNITACVDIPTPKTGYTTTQTLVPVNDTLNFTCTDENKIPDHDKLDPVQLICNENGEFGPALMANVSTWPNCRTHYECEVPPEPGSESGLSNSNSTGLREFHYAKYYCKEGRELPSDDDLRNDNEIDGSFSLQCGKVDGSAGKFPTDITWPNCTITHCLLNQLGTDNTEGFNATTEANPEVGGNVTLKCASSGQVTDQGIELGPFTCEDAGTFNIPSPLGPCREPLNCEIPSPNVESNLQNSTSSEVKEFEKLRFYCNAGFKIDPNQDYHEITCPNGREYGEITWPVCTLACDSKVEHPPTYTNLQVDTSSNAIRPNDHVTYSCKNGFTLNNVTLENDDGATMTIENELLKLQCNTSGVFPTPTWPNCTEVICDSNVETPPSYTNLKANNSSIVIRPNDFVIYSCENGFTLNDVTLENDDGVTMTIENELLKLQCNSAGGFPTPTWPNCTELPSGRRKRSSSSSERYSHLQDDIDYTILVLVESQFMWTDGIENEINSTTNKTREDRKEFPVMMIENFHDTLENTSGPLGPEDPETNIFNVNSLKVKSKTIRALCEQPINYNYEVISATTGQPVTENPMGLSNCIPSGSKLI